MEAANNPKQMKLNFQPARIQQVGSESKFISGYNALAKSNHNTYKDIERHENLTIHQNAAIAVLCCNLENHSS
ncbi:Hypothetical protein CINCED_3A002608 [Cinara cedri]|uniref:Uncharacterized protein n=1 Tax=Cinara cedri TaxID=506608 RepID=A0A5E4MFG9_9HEMI|nr:Hypothetical protein CINCED_3A002608 [Cinara cedri]